MQYNNMSGKELPTACNIIIRQARNYPQYAIYYYVREGITHSMQYDNMSGKELPTACNIILCQAMNYPQHAI